MIFVIGVRVYLTLRKFVLESDTMVIKSISFDNSEIIKSILDLHVHNHKIDCDVTFSKGQFYKDNGISPPDLKFDLVPQTEDTVKADCRELPLDDASIDCLMFDPPFGIGSGPSIKHSKPGSNVIINRFSVYPTPDALFDFYKDALTEFHRVLTDRGILIFKCQDTVSSGTNYMSHIYIHDMAVRLGFYPKDLFVLNAKNRLISGKHTNQQHARKFHSYFWVFEKGNPRVSKINKFSTNIQMVV